METIKLGNSNAYKVIQRAIEIIKSGGVIVYPTDTVYGLGCDPFNVDAVRKLLRIKQRAESKGLLLLINSEPQLRRVAIPTPRQLKIIKQYWPGPLTVVLSKSRVVSSTITGRRRTVAVRWADNMFIKKLLEYLDNPVVSTSANISKQSPAHTAGEAIRQFNDRRYQPDLVIDAGRLPNNPPSTIIQFTGRKIKVVRQGALHINEANGQH